jgi:hypothetical protein
MNINQHNYEEYFLLYADGELSAQGKLAVEQFVQGNPYLAEELDMFMQLKLPVEDIVFEEKSLLLKHDTAIGLKNYEEYFLLYIDNELDAAGKQSVETFVLQHPALQEQFMQLKQARLEPETILFPDKASLYRKEEKERRVFYMRWQRVAVAAAFIGLAVLGWKWFPSSNETVNAPITAQNKPTATNNTGSNNTSNNNTATETTEQQIAAPTTTDRPIIVTASLDNNGRATSKTETQIFTENIVTETPVKRTTNEPANTVRTEIAGDASVHLNDQKLVDKRFVPVAATDETPVIAQQAIYRELNTETEDEKKSLYVGSLEINKDKLRGFFRKATSLFRGKAKQQEEEEKTEATPSTNTRSLK